MLKEVQGRGEEECEVAWGSVGSKVFGAWPIFKTKLLIFQPYWPTHLKLDWRSCSLMQGALASTLWHLFRKIDGKVLQNQCCSTHDHKQLPTAAGAHERDVNEPEIWWDVSCETKTKSLKVLKCSTDFRGTAESGDNWVCRHMQHILHRSFGSRFRGRSGAAHTAFFKWKKNTKKPRCGVFAFIFSWQ